jgi:hypothetical protein
MVPFWNSNESFDWWHGISAALEGGGGGYFPGRQRKVNLDQSCETANFAPGPRSKGDPRRKHRDVIRISAHALTCVKCEALQDRCWRKKKYTLKYENYDQKGVGIFLWRTGNSLTTGQARTVQYSTGLSIPGGGSKGRRHNKLQSSSFLATSPQF